MLLLAATLLTQGPALHAQKDGLLVSTTHVADGPGTTSARTTEVRNEHAGKRAVLELQAVDELLIVGSTDQGGTYRVEIRDEQGRLVHEVTTSLAEGRRLLPVAVDGLLPGRYVACISSPHDAQVLRFRCD